nr:DUF397 domain-containing protein [Streptomyces spongiicola]
MAVRDSKDVGRQSMIFSRQAVRALVGGIASTHGDPGRAHPW